MDALRAVLAKDLLATISVHRSSAPAVAVDESNRRSWSPRTTSKPAKRSTRTQPRICRLWGFEVQMIISQNGEDRKQHHGAYLYYAVLPSATTRTERLNSSAMITVKIMPERVWNTSCWLGSKGR